MRTAGAPQCAPGSRSRGCMPDWGFTLALLTNGVLLAGFLIAGTIVMAGAPFWLGVTIAVVSMVAFGFGLERVVLRPLLGRPVVAVIMATIGLAAVLRGAAPLFYGAETRSVVLPI